MSGLFGRFVTRLTVLRIVRDRTRGYEGGLVDEEIQKHLVIESAVEMLSFKRNEE
jgi:hypothetical protein